MRPGGCREWFTVQHFVEIDRGDAAITWATPDAPLACFQDINRGKWLTELPMTNGHVYAYVMNNYWHTNYKAGQGGDHVFHFSVTSRPKADNVASARFGWAVANPLLGVVVPANPQGALPGEPTSLVAVAEPNVLITAMKRADDGKGFIVRLWELSGQPTTAHLRLAPHLRAAQATACNLGEDPSGPLELQNGQLCVPIRGAGLATLRIP
jgi:alpha-mannosidase